VAVNTNGGNTVGANRIVAGDAISTEFRTMGVDAVGNRADSQ
jgi:hypothetical protein